MPSIEMLHTGENRYDSEDNNVDSQIYTKGYAANLTDP